MMTGVSTNPGTYYMATGNSTTGINDTANTVNSVQQVSVSALGLNSSYGLVARASGDASTSYSMEVGAVDTGNTAVLNIFRSVNNAQQQHTIASVPLTALGPLTYGTEYNLKFLVESANSATTDLYADVWQQGTNDPDPGWPLTGAGSVNDSNTNLNGSGSNSSGYDGILAAPNFQGGSTDISYFSNYVESNIPIGSPPNDLPEITSFTSSPVPFSSSGSVTFNASATAPAVTLLAQAAAESISSYTLDFGDSRHIDLCLLGQRHPYLYFNSSPLLHR